MFLIGISAVIIFEMTLVSANHQDGPYPPSGWKPSGPKFETPKIAVTPVSSEHTTTQLSMNHSTETPFTEYGLPHNKSLVQNELTTIETEEPTTKTSNNKDEEVNIVDELNELNRKRRQKSEKLKNVEEFDVTTVPPSIEDKKLESSPTTKDMGSYYIYHPNGALQRIIYSTKDDRVNMEFVARLKYENVISIEDPLYTYDPNTFVLQRIH